MKHFSKITGVYVQLDFPEEWGDWSRIVDEKEGHDLHDAIWERWQADINEAMQPNGKSPFYGLGLAAIEDVTNGFDRGDFRILITSWDNMKQLNKTIEWAEKRMHLAYQDVCDCQTLMLN